MRLDMCDLVGLLYIQIVGVGFICCDKIMNFHNKIWGTIREYIRII